MFSRLRIYTVHVKPEAGGSPDKIRFIPEGFSWLAFFFGVLWALYHRLWLMAGFLVAANVLLALGIERFGMDEVVLSILQLGLNVWVGYHAYDFLRSKLRRTGYITYALVSGENLMRAEQRFFDRHSEVLAGV